MSRTYATLTPLIVAVVVVHLIHLGNAIIFSDVGLGLNLGLNKQKDSDCKTKTLVCTCGTTGSLVYVTIPQCLYAYRWKKKCRPCENMTSEIICPYYKQCLECHEDGQDMCAKCPPNKHGDWCDKDCGCRNGAECTRDGRCLCQGDFEGKYCERSKGCQPPKPTLSPLKMEFSPPDRPTTIVYKCPTDYELQGPSISTCLSNGQWSSEPPSCRKKCPLLSAPVNGFLKYEGRDLVEGTTAIVNCNDGYRLVGDGTMKCHREGKWDKKLPQCEKIAMCSDPGNVTFATRQVSENGFSQDGKVTYTCKQGFQQMGVDNITCLNDGTWSFGTPVCVKASTVVPNCQTTGSDVVSGVGDPVRVMCPPECASEKAQLWGTSIYRMESELCASAIHAGKLTNSGGLVDVINNGNYTNFAGSKINNINSQVYDGTDESFRFDKLPSRVHDTKSKGHCPKGLLKLETTCVHVSKSRNENNEADAICVNLGLQHSMPKGSEDLKPFIQYLYSAGIDKFWTGLPFDESNATSVTKHCEAAVLQGLEIVKEYIGCDTELPFVCTYSSAATLLASCNDPGALDNGFAKAVGKMDDIFYVGSSIEYTCERLHYLKGVSTISCAANGTWSHGKPICVKVDNCEEPPVPVAGFVNYLPAFESSMSQRSAITRRGHNIRMARLPAGMGAFRSAMTQRPQTSVSVTTPEPEPVITLPQGYHRVGTRAMYDCESRYYRLVGSRTRRCQEGGQWSGRAPTCIPVCGRSDSSRAPFIVNGNATDIGQWPWQAGLARFMPDYNTWFLLCGGSLLTERWVITAAHCVTYGGTNINIEPDKFRVYFGKYHRDDSMDDDYVQVKTIHEIHVHPDYDPGMFDADIALLQLESPVQLNSRVQPVCLPSEQSAGEDLIPGTMGVVTGWGMNENESYSNILQQAALPVVSRQECEKGYAESGLPLTVTQNMFCAGFKQGKMDACSGDSGGPMVFLDESAKERTWILEGIVSWGSPSGCGKPNQYGGFTDVRKFLQWIHLYF